MKMIEHKTTKLGNVAIIKNGGTPSTQDIKFWNGDIPWITPKDLSNYSQKYIDKGERNITKRGLECSSAQLLPKNTILFSSRAPIGYVAISNTELSTNQGFKNIVCKEKKLDYNYLYYWLIKHSSFIARNSIGSTFPEVTKGEMENLPISLPPLPEQKRIANILSSFDEKIELLKKQNETLENIAQCIFKEWFVEFNFPDENGKPYKRNGGKMKKSELGMIPEGWRVGKLANLVNIKNGFAFKSQDYVKKGCPIIRTMNFENSGYINDKSLVYISESKAKEYENFNFDLFDLCVVMVGASLGKIALITEANLPALQNQNMWSFKPKDELFRFYNNLVLLSLIKQNLNSASGSAREFLRKDYFYNVDILRPNNSIVKNFDSIICSLFKKISNNIIQIKTLSTIKNSLLSKIFN